MTITRKSAFRASEAEVGAFASLSGDTNKLHVDGDHAEDAFFGERVVHGVYVLSWVSSCLADLNFEGDVILDEFGRVDFKAPVAIDEPVEVRVFTAQMASVEDTGFIDFYASVNEVEEDGEQKLFCEGTIYVTEPNDG